jgi:hypothetical protein
MARLTIGQKAERVLKFLLALRNPRIAAVLVQYHFTQEDLDEGWNLLRNVTRTSLDVLPEDAPIDPDALRSLDEWENKWFAIAQATLKRRAPKVHDWVFRNLVQTEGVAVIVSVGTFVERLEQMDKAEKDGGLGAAGKEAKKLLKARGITQETIGAAKALLKKLGQVDGPLPDLEKGATDEATFEEGEKALWGWYLEWSKIARTAIKQRSLLRQLGFLRVTAGGKEEVEEDDDDDDVDDDDDESEDETGNEAELKAKPEKKKREG